MGKRLRRFSRNMVVTLLLLCSVLLPISALTQEETDGLNRNLDFHGWKIGQMKPLIDKLEYDIQQLTSNINSMEATSGELRVENDKLREYHWDKPTRISVSQDIRLESFDKDLSLLKVTSGNLEKSKEDLTSRISSQN